MRCSRRGVILYKYFANGYFVAYTSPPPTAEPLLKEKPFGECTSQLSPIAVQRLHSYSTRPRGTPILIGAGWRSQTEGETFKGTDGACADPDTRIFPATGAYSPAPPSSLIQSTFTSHAAFFDSFLGSKKESFPFVPPSLRPSFPSSLPVPRKKPLPMGGALPVALSLS